jgi:orotate phosphoribosyltransferase
VFDELLKKQIQEQAIKHGEFTLASGKKSPYYLDLKFAYTRPEVMKEIVHGIKEKIQGLKIDRIAGIELGAVPIIVAVSISTVIPFVIIRKERKGYGAGKRIEGEITSGDKVLLVEDVVTTGGSLASAVKAIRAAGGNCSMAVTVVDRLQGGEENLQKINIDLISLLTIEDLGL